MCDTIMISDALHFEQVAKLMDISVEQIRDLNPQYRSDIVPAGFGKSYALRFLIIMLESLLINKIRSLLITGRLILMIVTVRPIRRIVSRNTLMPMQSLAIKPNWFIR